MNEIQQQLKQLRKSLRQQRRALEPVTQQHHSICVTHNIMQSSLYRRSKRIAAYLANDGEIDPQYFIHSAWKDKKQLFLPVLSPISAKLYFAPYTLGCSMKANRFNIFEPNIHPKYWLKPRQLDLILMPLVGFDLHGNRLGMGGGFYDRSLAFVRHRKSQHTPYLMGLAHQLQCVDQLPEQAHDIALQYITTEAQQYHIR